MVWLGQGGAHGSSYSACCPLIPTALNDNAQMDADMEPSKALLRIVPARNFPAGLSACDPE